jgi:hypothetical protein
MRRLLSTADSPLDKTGVPAWPTRPDPLTSSVRSNRAQFAARSLLAVVRNERMDETTAPKNEWGRHDAFGHEMFTDDRRHRAAGRLAIVTQAKAGCPRVLHFVAHSGLFSAGALHSVLTRIAFAAPDVRVEIEWIYRVDSITFLSRAADFRWHARLKIARKKIPRPRSDEKGRSLASRSRTPPVNAIRGAPHSSRQP